MENANVVSTKSIQRIQNSVVKMAISLVWTNLAKC